MNCYIKYIYLSAFVLLFCCLTGKDNQGLAEQKLNQVRKSYNSLGAYSVNVTHRYFKNSISKKADYVYIGTFAQAPPKYYSNLLGIKTIQNGKYKLTLDTAARLLIVDEADSLYRVQNADFSTILKTCSSIQYSSDGGSTNIVLQFGKYDIYKTAHILISKQNLIQKIKLVHNSNDKAGVFPVTEIEYSGFRFSQPQKSLFDISGVMNINGKSIDIAKEYRKYTLLNNLIKF